MSRPFRSPAESLSLFRLSQPHEAPRSTSYRPEPRAALSPENHIEAASSSRRPSSGLQAAVPATLPHFCPFHPPVVIHPSGLPSANRECTCCHSFLPLCQILQVSDSSRLHILSSLYGTCCQAVHDLVAEHAVYHDGRNDRDHDSREHLVIVRLIRCDKLCQCDWKGLLGII